MNLSTRERTGGASCNRGRSGGPPQRFRIVLARGLPARIHQYVTELLRQRGATVEAGGMLAGSFSRARGWPTFTINGFIEAGPKAELSPMSILFDAEYQERMLEAIRIEHPHAGNMGCIHRHAGPLDQCSQGDKKTDRQAVRESDTKALVFAIITIDHPRPDPLSLRYRDFKISFYVMAEETGFEYVQVRPRLAELPLLEPSRALAQLSLRRGAGNFFDFAVLRHIEGLEAVSVRLLPRRSKTAGERSARDLQTYPLGSEVNNGSHSGLARPPVAEGEHPGPGTGPAILCQTRFQPEGATVRLLVEENGALKAFIQRPGAPASQFKGPWEDPETGRHIWLSHVLLLIRSRLRQANGAVRYGPHFSGLLEDKRRLVAEVRAMREKYGERAVLRHRKTRLYWEYTVVESGRRFPIEVRYPKHYPAEPPRIYSVLPLPPSPHQLMDNELCWMNRYAAIAEWNPARDTAVLCIHAAHRWFACLLVYLTLGDWPEGAQDDQPHFIYGSGRIR